MTELEITKRPVGRPPKIEAPAGEETPMQRAEKRLREIREGADSSPERDKFWAPRPPDGWDYQFKRKLVLGKEDPAYAVELLRQGWEPVPLSRHPEMMPRGWRGNEIEIEGLVLMERPAVLTKEARMRDDSAARESIRVKQEQLGQSKQGDLGRREVLTHRKSYAPIPVPADE